MSAINENLKLSRQAKGYTQEEVARQMHLTRQAISSYETNRTQPDIETLKRFAEVYDVAFDDILYGTHRTQRQHKACRAVALIALMDLLVCNVVQSVLLLTANTYFRVAEGAVTESASFILKTRFALLDAFHAVETFCLISFSLLGLVLLILLIMLERPVKIHIKLKFLVLLTLGSVVTILPWPFFDTLYGVFDYGFIAIRNLLFAWVLFGLSFVGEWLHKKFGIAPAKNGL